MRSDRAQAPKRSTVEKLERLGTAPHRRWFTGEGGRRRQWGSDGAGGEEGTRGGRRGEGEERRRGRQPATCRSQSAPCGGPSARQRSNSDGTAMRSMGMRALIWLPGAGQRPQLQTPARRLAAVAHRGKRDVSQEEKSKKANARLTNDEHGHQAGSTAGAATGWLYDSTGCLYSGSCRSDRSAGTGACGRRRTRPVWCAVAKTPPHDGLVLHAKSSPSHPQVIRRRPHPLTRPPPPLRRASRPVRPCRNSRGTMDRGPVSATSSPVSHAAVRGAALRELTFLIVSTVDSPSSWFR